MKFIYCGTHEMSQEYSLVILLVSRLSFSDTAGCVNSLSLLTLVRQSDHDKLVRIDS